MADIEPEQQTKTEEELLAWAKKYAQEHGYILNPDEKQLKTVIRGLARGKLKFGEQYCPCRIRTRDPGKDKEIICPCVYHEGEIEKDEHCHCNLFFRVTGESEAK